MQALKNLSRINLFPKPSLAHIDKRSLTTSIFRKYQWQNQNFQGEVTMISFNVLSQQHLDSHKYLYEGVNPKYLDWSYRERLLSEKFYNFITGDNVSIFCLQEVDKDKLESFYRPFFKSWGYEIIYLQRPDLNLTKPHHLKPQIKKFPDGCAIVYDTAKYKNIESDFIYYNSKDANISLSGRWSNPGSSGVHGTGSIDLNHSQVGLLTKFKSLENNKEFIIGTTHLAFNPNLGDVKLAQLCMLLHHIQKFVLNFKKSQFLPLILCGDFNIHATSPLFNEFIVNGEMNTEELLCSHLSGQINNSKNRKKIAAPPIPKELGIDYTNCMKAARDIKETEMFDDKTVESKEDKAYWRDYHEHVQTHGRQKGEQLFRKKYHWDPKKEGTGEDQEALFAGKFSLTGTGNNWEWFRDKHWQWDPQISREGAVMRLQRLNNDLCIFTNDVKHYIGHSLYLKMPYLTVYEKSLKNNKPFTTYLSKNNTETCSKLLVDHFVCTEHVPIYNYLKVPVENPDTNSKRTVLSVDNPSDHVPIGVNFDIPEVEHPE